MKKQFYSLFFLTCLFLYNNVQAQNVVTITDNDLQGGQTYTWTNDNIYLLDGFVFLEDGGTLCIEQGTVIKAKSTPDASNDLTSTLIITRGAKIFAEGTSRQPIIFTSEADDTDDPNDLLPTARGLWGGLVILGYGEIGASTDERVIEGFPSSETRALFGGSDNTDNSGVLKYVSIRHGGREFQPMEEINGLTLGAVGSETIIEHVEVFANLDDGIEWFGGAVDVKWASVAFCGDDGFDWDLGWKGKGQFWFNLQGDDEAGNGGEHDGASPDDATPFSNPTVYNATFIGSGVNAPDNIKNEFALLMRDNTAGTYANSIFTDYKRHALQVEDLDAGNVDSYGHLLSGELKFLNNIWFNFGEGTELNCGDNGILLDNGGDNDCSALISHLGNNGNTLDDPALSGISRTTNGGLDPRPGANNGAYSNLADLPSEDPFFSQVDYKGAFGDHLWLRGWSALEEYGLLPARGDVTVTDADLATGTYNWTSDNVYTLDGFVFLEAGGTLNIGPGTIIKAKSTPDASNDLTSTLIITRGAQIFANGTASDPIIFTSEADMIDQGEVNLMPNQRGLWGGLVILGNGVIGASTDERVIEGFPSSETRALFGGNDNTESSGSIRYVSIRHGGREFQPMEEINGLTLGAVGSGTTIEFVEVIANLDDGIEWFGGAVDVKYATVSFCGDDGYDWDLGWVGKGQYWFNLQGDDEAGNGGEHDGASPDDATPFSNPTVFNATYIGSGVNAPDNIKNEFALLLRDNTAGIYANSIFTDFKRHALQVEDLDAGNVDSYAQLEGGLLKLEENIWWQFGEGTELNCGDNGILLDNGGDKDCSALINHLTDNGNSLEDPQLGGISRDQSGGLDPRPDSDGPAYDDMPLSNNPANGYTDKTFFKGAFCSEGVWIKGWTGLSDYKVLDLKVPYADGTCDTEPGNPNSVNTVTVQGGYLLRQNAPNPAYGVTDIVFELPRTTKVTLSVFDVTGRMVAQPINNERHAEGIHTVEFNTLPLSSGIYFYTLHNEEAAITRKMIVNK